MWTLLVSLYVYLPFRQITPHTNIGIKLKRIANPQYYTNHLLTSLIKQQLDHLPT